MKKKIAVIAAVFSILAILIIGSSLAWFTDEDAVKNTFIVGEIKIKQNEREYGEDGKLQEFTQNQTLLPITNLSDVSSDKHYVEKLVTVENVGRNKAYVRTFIAVPEALKEVLRLDFADVSSGWIQDEHTEWGTVEVEDVLYHIISFTYNKALTKGETTPEVLKGVYLDASVDLQKNQEGKKQFCTMNEDGLTYRFYDFDVSNTIQILVATQGCQVDGLTGEAVDALNTAFGRTVPDFTKVNP